MTQLSTGSIMAILGGEPYEKPIIQLLGLKPVSKNSYRLLISDGKNSSSCAMLSSQLNDKVINNEIETNTVIRADRYQTNKLCNKQVIIIFDLTVVKTAEEVGKKLGNPVPIQGDLTQKNNQTNGNSVKPETPTTPVGSKISSRPLSNGSPSKNVHPICSLNPYQNRWTIRVRVTNKSDIRKWSNSKGEGKLFSMDLIDDSGEIRATAFNEQCDQYHDMIEVNKVYYISKATLKNANKAFTSIKNDYEITFNNGTEVVPCDDMPDDLPVLQFDFVPINNMESLAKDTIVDVLGVCRSFGDLQTIVARTTGKELQKRDIHLLDQSNTEITLTFWGETAAKFDGSRNPVIAVKGARLSEFNGRSLSVLHSSVLHIDPDIKEAHTLRGWYDSEGSTMSAKSITSNVGGIVNSTNWKQIHEVDSEGLGKGEKPDYYSLKATISLIKYETALYKACPSQECNKKVIDFNNGMYRCEKCNQEYSGFKWRLLLQVLISDFSGSKWVSFFQESAETIIKLSADELGNMKEASEKNSDTKFSKYMTGCCFGDFIFKLRTKLETYKDESRLKTVGVSVTPIDNVDYGRKLIADIKKLSV